MKKPIKFKIKGGLEAFNAVRRAMPPPTRAHKDKRRISRARAKNELRRDSRDALSSRGRLSA